jgi:hypothetical protein
LKEVDIIHLYCTGTGDLNHRTMELLEFNFSVNGLVVCWRNAWPAGMHVNHDTKAVKVKMHLREMGYGNVNWIEVVQDCVQW